MIVLRKRGNSLHLFIPYLEKRKLDDLIVKGKWDSTSKSFVFPADAVTDLLALFPDVVCDADVEECFSSYKKKIRQLSLIQTGNLPFPSILNALPKEIREYQKTGVFFLHTVGEVLLADEMGLGKALQSLSLSLLLKEEGNVKRVLIVCPNSIKYSVWEKEIKKWTTGLTYLILDGSREQKLHYLKLMNLAAGLEQMEIFYLVVNYETLRKVDEKKSKKREVTEYWKEIKAWKPDLVILDECQAIKNASSQQSKAVKEMDAPYKILLTGTPVLNRVEELWSLLNYLNPKYWNSYYRFIHKYCTFKKIWIYVKGRRRSIETIDGSQNIEELQEKIFPYYLRRIKQEVMPYLPERIYETRLLQLLPDQRKKYNSFIDEIKQEMQETNQITRTFVLGKLVKLLEVCDGLSLFDLEDCSSKLDECEEIYDELSQESKIVFFTWFVKTAKTLQARLLKKGVNVVEIDGAVDAKERKNLIDKFQNDPSCKVLVATISTCGVGIDLTASNICVFVSRSYTPAINDQAESRLHRSGQKKAVNIITLVTEGTVEERVSKILENKKSLFETIFQDKERIREMFESLAFGGKNCD